MSLVFQTLQSFDEGIVSHSTEFSTQYVQFVITYYLFKMRVVKGISIL